MAMIAASTRPTEQALTQPLSMRSKAAMTRSRWDARLHWAIHQQDVMGRNGCLYNVRSGMRMRRFVAKWLQHRDLRPTCSKLGVPSQRIRTTTPVARQKEYRA